MAACELLGDEVLFETRLRGKGYHNSSYDVTIHDLSHESFFNSFGDVVAKMDSYEVTSDISSTIKYVETNGDLSGDSFKHAIQTVDTMVDTKSVDRVYDLRNVPEFFARLNTNRIEKMNVTTMY